MVPFHHVAMSRRRQLLVGVALSVLSICGLGTTLALATEHARPAMVYEITSSDDASRSGTIERAPAVELEIAPPVEEPVLQEVFEAPVQALWIPALRINAPLVPMGVRRDGYMDLPYNPYQVAWYYFTGKPGMGGNAVFSAHVDYINYGPAVFWGLSRLRPGDDVAITLTDGVQLNYSVVDSYVIPRGQLDINALIAPTEVETLTLITCGGTFAYNDYSHRVVVRATRISAQRA